MDDRQVDADVVVVGGGPAGSATAIACAAHGLRVRLFEREVFACDRPGETLHPGIESLLDKLGVSAQRLEPVVGARPEGIWVDWRQSRRFEPYGRDAAGTWRGFQVWRADFDALLLARAAESGVRVCQPCGVSGVLRENGDITGVVTAAGPVTAHMMVDASGRAGWLCRILGIQRPVRSPRLIARYGYADGCCPERDEAPALVGDASGWQWTAMVRPGTYQWTRVRLDGGPLDRADMPDEFHGLVPRGPSRGADVTWRMASEVARSRWFMVGDAAAILDPTSSHGVLKALLSGITAGHLIAAVLAGKVPAVEAAKVYHEWVAGWFANDAARLSGFYREIGVSGFEWPARDS